MGMGTAETTTRSPRRSPRLGRALVVAAAALALYGTSATAALANSPNPTSVHIDSYSVSGSNVTVTVSGTWTWQVPNGAQQDCNDSRIGVGYAVSWGDNAANPLKSMKGEPTIDVGTASDDWVHSVTEGTQTVAGPFKKGPVTLEESMLGQTPEAMLDGFGAQGISTGASTAIPTNVDAERWVSNCGPTAQSLVDGVTIGNSDPAEPTKGFPSGTWGPISHTYTTPGPHTICPVMYDPHGKEVGQVAQNAKEITAGGTNYNNDNSVESNGNASECTVTATLPPPEPALSIEKLQEIKGSGAPFTKEQLIGAIGQTVDYEVIVRNTGNVTVALGHLIDVNCTNISGGAADLAPGGATIYTCEHLLTRAGTWTNEAVVEAAGKVLTSNRVTVGVPKQEVKAVCTISESAFVLHGATGSKRGVFTVRISSLGIKRITFYLDGRRLKTLSASKARHGEFELRINAKRLRYGAHRISVTTVMKDAACARIGRAAVFVRPRPARATPKFTG